MFQYDRGIKLPQAPLWLDAVNVVERCCVSHGHADHIRRHRAVFATPATASFMRRRLGKVSIQEVEFGSPFSVGPYRITFLPAGHILGSAQILVENDAGDTLLYSGDFKIEAGGTAEPLQPAHADVLIMECTYGQPHYRFPSREELTARLIHFVNQTLGSGRVPLVLGYALGKAQEAMKILGEAGFTLAVHSSVMKMAEVYQRHGVDFGHVVAAGRSDDPAGKVYILPPQVRKQRWVQRLGPVRSVFLSGWGIDPGARFRFGVDEVLPLSDHADFDGLLQYIEMVQPKKIYTTHGPNDFYLYLRSRGYDAHPLVPPKQAELF